MKRIIALLVFSCACALADGDYVLFKKTVLAGATDVLTVAQPTSGGKTVRFRGAYVYCTSATACDFTLERDGTAPTGASTAITTCSAGLCGLNSTSNAPKVLAYSASDVGAGAMAIPYTVPAGGWVAIDISKLALFGNGAAKNVSIRPVSMTATITIHLYFSEN